MPSPRPAVYALSIFLIILAFCWPQRLQTWSWMELAGNASPPTFSMAANQAPSGSYFRTLLTNSSDSTSTGLWLRWAKGRSGSLFFAIDDPRGAPSRAVLQLIADLEQKDESSRWSQELSNLRAEAPEGSWGDIEALAAALMTASSRLNATEYHIWVKSIPNAAVLKKAASWIQLYPDSLNQQLEIHRQTPGPLFSRLYDRIESYGRSAFAQALELCRHHPESYLLWLSDGRPVREDWQQKLWFKTFLSNAEMAQKFTQPIGQWAPVVLLALAFGLFLLFGVSSESRHNPAILLAVLALYVGFVALLETQVSGETVALQMQWEKVAPTSISNSPIPSDIKDAPMTNDLDSRSLQLIFFFLALQVVVLILSCMSIQKISKSNESPAMRLRLLENDEHLYDLGLYIGLGGTVLSLIFLIMGQNQQGMMAAYTSTLFGILEVAMFKVLILRPYRHKLIVQS